MKKIIALALFAATGSFAFDQYLPVAKGKLETDVMFSYTSYTGAYDNDAEKQDLPSGWSASEMAPSLALKYGVIDGLDVELALTYRLRSIEAEEDGETYSDDINGLDRTDLAVKYAHPELGVGGFVNVSLPFGSEDIVGEEPATSILAGAIYGKTLDKVVVNAWAGYKFNTEDANKTKQDLIDIYAQGQFNVNPMVGPYLGVDFINTFDETTDGETTEDNKEAGYLLTLKPGANVVINDKMAAELTVPFTVMGKNQDATWGIYAGFYYTFGL